MLSLVMQHWPVSNREIEMLIQAKARLRLCDVKIFSLALGIVLAASFGGFFQNKPISGAALADGCERGYLPFNIVGTVTDPNGFPLNPQWAQKACKSTVPTTEGTCDKVVTCTHNAISIDRATSTRFVCHDLGKITHLGGDGTEFGGLVGHANWEPATFFGSIEFEDGGFDHDYNFNLYPNDGAGLANTDPYIHTEADSGETFDSFTDEWWSDWDQDPPKTMQYLVAGRRASITGLLSMDCEHDCNVELHPIYGLAIDTNENEGPETWRVFGRLYAGNEGFCSHLIHPLPVKKTLWIFLPHSTGSRAKIVPGLTSLQSDLKWGNGWDQITLSSLKVDVRPGQGAFVSLPISDPNNSVVDGYITIKWNLPQTAVRALTYTPPSPTFEDQIVARLRGVVSPKQRSYLDGNFGLLRRLRGNITAINRRFLALFSEALKQCVHVSSDCGPRELIGSNRIYEVQTNAAPTLRSLLTSNSVVGTYTDGSGLKALSTSTILLTGQELHVIGPDAFYPTKVDASSNPDQPLSASEALRVRANLVILQRLGKGT